MIYLIIILIITHIVVLYQLKKYLKAYKENNYNYITSELKKINQSFNQGINGINLQVNTFSQNTDQTFESLKKTTSIFTRNYSKNFNELTSFIKSDYKSMIALVEGNSNLLGNLLQRTEENIVKNKELKPVLVDSHNELEKVYSKIKLLISGYEKSLKSIQNEMEDTLMIIENNMDAKIKQLSVKGEKTISESLEVSKNTIHTLTDETNAKLKTILHDNQIRLLTDKVHAIEQELKANLLGINNTIEGLDNMFIQKLKEHQESNKEKKGFFGF
ncbi:hypothetical protein IWQ47_003509 [Aquimarina sp. EL_43]|uniref:hypothetical protein n=1 Tax=unclassified Aquimarina TaxID=2627091 RepID=UPI0018C99661|nr:MULTISPECIES: hypothetical protein [unclassified Aquimarina]MBG6131749.1 putative PurR-regulated permease PerM [Aquimarina sp. EL_35]MBG6149313.1 putative PurR-regulated permease PerM [Aquimarina sp. EL_32]MBG6170424.1 hypothetical protein [Aquimarina sp. EL_43]